MPRTRKDTLEEELKLIIGNIVSKYVFRFLYIFGTILFIAGGWITKNQLEISSLQKVLNEQQSKLLVNDKLCSQHEWMVLNHETRLNDIEAKRKK